MKYASLTLLILMFGISELKSQDLAFTSIREVPKVKRGKNYEINWRGGNPTDNISIALIDKKSKEITLSTLANDGGSVVRIPSRVKPGAYTVRITNATSGQVAFSESIRIKRRIPLGVVIGAVVLVPTTIYLLVNSNQGPDLPEVPAPNTP